jgi:hypothetical protein
MVILLFSCECKEYFSTKEKHSETVQAEYNRGGAEDAEKKKPEPIRHEEHGEPRRAFGNRNPGENRRTLRLLFLEFLRGFAPAEPGLHSFYLRSFAFICGWFGVFSVFSVPSVADW